MKQINTLAIKLSMFIIAAAGIVSACTMNCGCCDPVKALKTETAACHTEQVSTVAHIPLVTTTLNESGRDMQDTCNSCNCNTLPKKESSAVSSGMISLKIHITPVSVPKRLFFTQQYFAHTTIIISLDALSAHSTPLRI
ncbi:MAG: hypothetical protein ACM31E_01950 [Fibrobacterota bacterium]